MNLQILTGLLLGAAYGYVAQRGAFCLNSGFRFVTTKRDMTKIKALGLALAVQMIALPVVFALGWAQPNFPAFFLAHVIQAERVPVNTVLRPAFRRNGCVGLVMGITSSFQI